MFSSRSSFTTFWCQKVAPKASARRKSRGTAAGLRLKRYADELAPAFLDGASDARSVSRFFARRSLRCGARKQDDLFPQDTGLRIGLSYLRTEDCGARILRASARGGFGPRGAPWRRSVAASRSFILASPKILRLDNVQINLTLPSLNRTLADAEDTPTRQLQINLHCARLNRIFAPLWRRDYTKNKRYTTLQRSPN